MKRARIWKYLQIAAMLGLLLLAAACSNGEKAAEPSATPAEATQPPRPPVAPRTPDVTPSPFAPFTPQPTPTILRPTIPDKIPTPSPTASPSITPKVSPSPSPTPQIQKTELTDDFYYVTLDDTLKARITGMSYPDTEEKLKITYGDLRYIRLLHYDFEGKIKAGELIVHKKLADEVMEIFYELYQNKYPLQSVRLVDDYGEPGNDNLSMAANNTSAFNYRLVSGTKTLSRHSYGAAIDINPLYNPYINGDHIGPPGAAQYADRSKSFPGKIDHDDLCYQLFIEHGWEWGGDWKGDKDYQHFSKDL